MTRREPRAVADVVHFQRRPFPGYFSLERLFADVRRAMPPEVSCRLHVAPCLSRGFWRRLWNIFDAMWQQGDINHVTGDVHYVDLLLRQRKTLLTIHDCAPLERLRGWKRALLRLFWYSLPIRRASLVSVVSETTKRELLRHVSCAPEKIHVVHCCVSGLLQRDPRPFNQANPRVLQIGTGKNKNLPRVAEALAGLPCHLVIIGRPDAEQEAALRRHAIDFSATAELTDDAVAEAYRQCDLVVFASTYEGFGLPIAEANAIGRPVVTSNLLSMPEVAGNSACLVDPFDVSSIRAGILRIIEDAEYRTRLIENGYRNAQRFSAARIASQYLSLYRELLERST